MTKLLNPEHSSVAAHDASEPAAESNGADKTPYQLWLVLTLIVLASFAVRIAALLHWGTGAIESEGAEYTRIAQNLRNGVGYVGIVSPGPQVVFPPLFPLLIAAASFLIHNFEWAGRMVSLVLGGLLPLPVFGMASRIFNRRVGLIAAALVVLHPVLVNLSFAVLSEAPYTTLFLVAAYAVVRALDHPSTRSWSLVGAAFGLAYLTRQEATAALAISVLFGFLVAKAGSAVKCKRAAAALAMFFVLALPEVMFIYRATGKVLLEGKSTQFFALGERILVAEKSSELPSPNGELDAPSSAPDVASWEPWQAKWAFYAIDANLNMTGVAMRPQAQVVRETHIAPKQLLGFLAKGIRLAIPNLLESFSQKWFGAPLLPALALLGAFGRPWRGPRASTRLFVLLVSVAPVIATFSAFWTQTRYYFVLVPFLLIWAANGLYEIGLWAQESSAAAGWRIVASPAVSQVVIPALIGLLVVVTPLKAIRSPQFIFAEGSPSNQVKKELGLWIGHQQKGPVRLIDLGIPVAFHANALWVKFPYCSADVALRFLDASNVDYVVLRRGSTFTKYYESWIAQGIPDSRAELLHISPSVDAQYVVYRWHPAS